MTMIDTATGEVVARRPTIAAPTAPVTSMDIATQCRSIEVWAQHCNSIDELREADHKLAAIGEYVRRTSTEGRAKVEAARRRLEARIGQLLGPAKCGPPAADESSLASEDSLLTANDRSHFRKLADHPDIVDAVIDESTDEAPASRRRVLDEINRRRSAAPTEEETAAAEHAAWIRRAARRCEKFLDGYEQVVTLRTEPDRDEILAALTEPDRTRLLAIEQELPQ